LRDETLRVLTQTASGGTASIYQIPRWQLRGRRATSAAPSARADDEGEGAKVTAFAGVGVRFTVYGVPIAMKNNRRIFKSAKTGRPIVIGSAKSLAYAADFERQVPATARLSLGGPDSHLRLSLRLYYPNWRFDADFASISDCLQRAGVISNDRWIRVISIDARELDKANPRAEILIEPL